MRNNGGACLPGGMQVMNGWSCGLGCKTRGGLLTWWFASLERVVVRARVRNDGGACLPGGAWIIAGVNGWS